MTRQSIATVLRPLLIVLLIAVNAPAVGADTPCILDNAGNCAAAGGDFTAQEIAAFDALSATAPGVTAASGSPVEDDQIRTALEMTNTPATIPVAAYQTGPTTEHARG